MQRRTNRHQDGKSLVQVVRSEVSSVDDIYNLNFANCTTISIPSGQVRSGEDLEKGKGLPGTVHLWRHLALTRYSTVASSSATTSSTTVALILLL